MGKIVPELIKLYLVILLLTLSAKSYSIDSDKQLYELHQDLQTVPAEERLPFLEDYCKKHTQDENYREFLRFYEEEATRMNNKHHLGNALTMLGRHYYPVYPDSLKRVINRLKPIVEENKEYVGYIDIWALYNYSLVWEGKNEELDKSANALKTYSQQVNYAKGLELADLNMAYFYYTNGMVDEAEKVYLDVLDRKIKRDSPLAERISILNQLFHYMTDNKKREKYLLEADEQINVFKEQPNNSEEDKNSVQMYEFAVYSTHAELLITAKRFDEAYERLKQLDSIPVPQSFREERLMAIHNLYFSYYFELEKYDEALLHLGEIEQLVRKSRNLENIKVMLSNKRRVYIKQNKFEDLSRVQDELIQLKDSINQSNFQEKIADVRARYEMDRLELEKKEMEIEAEKTRSQATLLFGGCVLLLLALCGLTFVMRSIQRSKQALREAKEKAENADRMKSAFLANMNHEIRTPLNAIVGFSQLIIEEVDPENKQEFAQIIESNNELLQRLIGDVLDISKIESNSMSLIYKQYETCQIMKELYNSISLRVPETLEFILDPCEAITIETDRNRLVQVITNLLTNAIKHTQQGHIRFGFERQDAQTLYFYVEDTGEGIPPEQVDKIFDRFVQLENGTKGVGLGLAICKGLITQMGGCIGVTSVYGEGSTFYFTLPLERKV
ncbi:HAMP domain-containing sensor histidine kinase [Parabacteroides sp. PF5-6]|uniref:tetratricopeptide repeat-containing sensor histidine kinase n=1 Tax=Parabacteroides sp. PF5-6 TaxID=1742403 RepID=UPI002406EE12|nr:HAMP domain-containing sensor histidine kinase [Parabacteroides sp. PF5-6]MDF9831149.1 signal transduction histidine kinase [Parabacteroides sp. PF5-6]